MKSHHARATVACTAFMMTTLLALPHAVVAADYAIKLERPVAKGETYRTHVTTTAIRKLTITLPGKEPVLKNSEVKVTLVGDIEVLEISPRGREAKVSCKVVSCKVAQPNAEPADVVPAGTIVVAFREGKVARVSNADGTPLKQDVESKLELVLRVPDPQGVDEDATLGSKERRKVGDEWDIKVDEIIADSARVGVPLVKNGVEGKVKLVATRKVGEVECLVLDAAFKLEVQPGGTLPNMPPQMAGMTFKSGTVRMSMQQDLPVDVARQSLASVKSMITDIVMTGPSPDGTGPMEIMSKETRSQETRRENK